ncbi:MAG TPA: hypothetical protein VHV74_09015 [Pseudonocardiaceae bacterium]|jgi:hypothetical protein|nr:hypothetical protein [Pseudonocardiaceae bacterium]
MRCANLADTWTELADWLDQRDVLVLPPLAADLPLARLDAGNADVVAAVWRLRRLIEHFAVRAVYVHIVDGVRVGAREAEPAVVTVRALAAGAVHELKLFADWYVELLDSTMSAEAHH